MTITSNIWTFLVLLSGILGIVQSSGTFNYSSWIYHSVGTSFQETLNFPPSNKIIANYFISYNSSKCCPVVWLGHKSWVLPETRGYYVWCSTESLREVALYTPFLILAKVDYPNSGCRYEGTRTVCNGTRTLTALQPIKWELAATYECATVQNLDLFVEADIQYITNFNFTCEPIEISFCRDHFGYNATVFPNVIGQESAEANKMLALYRKVKHVAEGCYQHATLIICYVLFPPCRNVKIPCRKMCHDLHEGCNIILKQANQPLPCDPFPSSLDPDVCFYRPVECQMPQSPQFGTVVVEGHKLGDISKYRCNVGYELRGEPVLRCEPSGHWNSSTPSCEPALTMGAPASLISRQRTIILGSLIPAVLLIIMIIVCVYHKENIKTFILYNRHNPFYRNTPDQKTLFIAYSGQDREEVSSNFVPRVKEQLHDWTVETYQDDFTAGRPILDCIKEGVWESQAVLVLLTQNFMKSSWCLHEFIEAETRTALEDGFRLIVVMFSQDNQGLPMEVIEGLPESLKRYIRSRVYLALWEPLFWNKLRQALAK